jgi:hypothetical protein
MIKLVANKSKILADHVEQIVKLVTATQNVTIECSNSINELKSPDNLTITKEYNDIYFNNKRMEKIKHDDEDNIDGITLDEKENTITITNTSSKDAGIYECKTDYYIKKWNEKSKRWREERYLKTTRSVALYVFSMISLFK